MWSRFEGFPWLLVFAGAKEGELDDREGEASMGAMVFCPVFRLFFGVGEGGEREGCYVILW
jgi:hypothetical protein